MTHNDANHVAHGRSRMIRPCLPGEHQDMVSERKASEWIDPLVPKLCKSTRMAKGGTAPKARSPKAPTTSQHNIAPVSI